jgi:adenosylcobinamide kinase / adenosylcobinamide-phosphate guanylyltransferase
MHFIFGGRCMGKLDYAKTLKSNPVICDLSYGEINAMFDADIICNVHLLVRDMVRKQQNSAVFFEDNMNRLQGKIIIGDEVGSGVVPMEPIDREWRDETGRVYQLLAKHAHRVTRIWAGIPQELKREEDRPCKS